MRRLALYIEESLFRGTQWVVFEPNDASVPSHNSTRVPSDFFRPWSVHRTLPGSPPAPVSTSPMSQSAGTLLALPLSGSGAYLGRGNADGILRRHTWP